MAGFSAEGDGMSNAAFTLHHPNLRLCFSAIDLVLNSKENVDIVDRAALLCLRLEEEQSQETCPT